MNQTVNVIENENVSITTNYNNNDNVVVLDKYAAAKKVEIIADALLAKLNMPVESRAFMCKVALKLSEARIWDNVEQSLKGKNPIGLFIYLCKRDGVWWVIKF